MGTFKKSIVYKSIWINLFLQLHRTLCWSISKLGYLETLWLWNCMYFTDIFFTLIPIQLEVPIAAPHSSKNMNPFYIMFLKDKTFHTHTTKPIGLFIYDNNCVKSLWHHFVLCWKISFKSIRKDAKGEKIIPHYFVLFCFRKSSNGFQHLDSLGSEIPLHLLITVCSSFFPENSICSKKRQTFYFIYFMVWW